MLHSADLPNELPAFERWLLRYHAPEVMAKDIGLQVRFISYRPIPVIPEVLNYGYYNMRVTEVWFRSAGRRRSLAKRGAAPGGRGSPAAGADGGAHHQSRARPHE